MKLRINFSGRSIRYTEDEIATVVEAMRNAEPLTQGHYLQEFESAFARYQGVEEGSCFAVCNATAALEMSAQLCRFKDGDELDLGNKTLQFHLTPMIHWPETMMTYVVENKVLFSGDAFGCFGALNGGILDSETDTCLYYSEMARYYSNIVAKYGMFVQKALAKLSGIQIDYICSTHGPVWHQDVDKVISEYDRLSKNEAEEGVVIAYGSMYGNTEEMVDIISRQLAICGIRKIRIHNVSYTDESYILRDIYKYRGLIIASPTYNGQAFPKIESLLRSLQLRGTANKVFARIGSFTWASAAVKNINALIEKLNFTVVGDPIEMKQGITPEIVERCKALATEFANQLKSSK